MALEYADFVRDAQMNAVIQAIGPTPSFTLLDAQGVPLMQFRLPAQWAAQAVGGRLIFLAERWGRGICTHPGVAASWQLRTQDGMLVMQGTVSRTGEPGGLRSEEK